MKITLDDFKENDYVVFTVNEQQHASNLFGLGLTEGAKHDLMTFYIPCIVEDISKRLHEQMLDSMRKESLDAASDEPVKQERYKDENNKDLIDQWEQDYSIEVFRVLMWEQMRK